MIKIFLGHKNPGPGRKDVDMFKSSNQTGDYLFVDFSVKGFIVLEIEASCLMQILRLNLHVTDWTSIM